MMCFIAIVWPWGGKEKWENLKSYQQVFTRPNGLKLTISCLMPDKITIRFQKDSIEVTKAFDGQSGYIIKNGQYEPMRSGEAIEMAEEPHYYSDLIIAKDKGYEVSDMGKEQLDGIHCYKLKLKKSEKDEQIYWLNPTTYLIEQTAEYSEDGAHNGVYFKTRLSDYRDIEGYQFPFQQRLIANDQARPASICTEVKVNFESEISDFEYQPNSTANLIRYWKDTEATNRLKAFTFVQETIRLTENASQDTSTWYEAIQYPNNFRIDFGEKSNHNSNLYRNDSIYVMRKAKMVHQAKQIEEFMIMEGALYALPVDSTLAKLEAVGIDVDLFDIVNHNNRLTYIVGAKQDNKKLAQIWLDAERRYAVRRFSKTQQGSIMEVRYDDFKHLDGHWVESWLEFYVDDKLIQTERYYHIDVNPKLPQQRCLTQSFFEIFIGIEIGFAFL